MSEPTLHLPLPSSPLLFNNNLLLLLILSLPNLKSHSLLSFFFSSVKPFLSPIHPLPHSSFLNQLHSLLSPYLLFIPPVSLPNFLTASIPSSSCSNYSMSTNSPFFSFKPHTIHIPSLCTSQCLHCNKTSSLSSLSPHSDNPSPLPYLLPLILSCLHHNEYFCRVSFDTQYVLCVLSRYHLIFDKFYVMCQVCRL